MQGDPAQRGSPHTPHPNTPPLYGPLKPSMGKPHLRAADAGSSTQQQQQQRFPSVGRLSSNNRRTVAPCLQWEELGTQTAQVAAPFCRSHYNHCVPRAKVLSVGGDHQPHALQRHLRAGRAGRTQRRSTMRDAFAALLVLLLASPVCQASHGGYDYEGNLPSIAIVSPECPRPTLPPRTTAAATGGLARRSPHAFTSARHARLPRCPPR